MNIDVTNCAACASSRKMIAVLGPSSSASRRIRRTRDGERENGLCPDSCGGGGTEFPDEMPNIGFLSLVTYQISYHDVIGFSVMKLST